MKEKIKAIRAVIAKTKMLSPEVKIIFKACGEEQVLDVYIKHFWKVDLENGSFDEGFQAGKSAVRELANYALSKLEIEEKRQRSWAAKKDAC